MVTWLFGCCDVVVLLFLWVDIVWLVTLLIFGCFGFYLMLYDFGDVDNGVLLLYLLVFAC